MASTAIKVTDQCLVEETTYGYQGVQTQIPKVPVISVSPTSVLQDSRKRSSQVVEILLSQITRCLDCTSENKQTREENAGNNNVTVLLIHTRNGNDWTGNSGGEGKYCRLLCTQSCIMSKKVFPETKLLRFIESFIFPDQSKLIRTFTQNFCNCFFIICFQYIVF